MGAQLDAGEAALQAGRWDEARAEFAASIAEADSAYGRFGLATALWWLGDNLGSVEHATRAYAMFRRSGDDQRAIESALWLAIVYKANFANASAANGWTRRAERLLGDEQPGLAHALLWVTQAYRMADLDAAERLTRRALDVARNAGEVDIELTAVSQLGLILVGKGAEAEGFALIDEAMAAALGGEAARLDTVVYTCCDMLLACELASDASRAAEWCKVADGFVETYGCPFLYAECRIYYGSVLTSTGRWGDADRELHAGLRITEDVCPGLHRRALTRLAALRLRQGRLEDAEALLTAAGGGTTTDAEMTLSAAALLLARGDGAAASRLLERRARSLGLCRQHEAAALDLLVDAHLAAGRLDDAATACGRLASVVASVDRLAPMAPAATGRVSAAGGDEEAAVAQLETAVDALSRLELPYETARAQLELGQALAAASPDAAVGPARRALETFEQLGATLDADRAAALLRSLGVVARVGPKRVGVLTAREQEVFRLVGRGLSNPEIAQRLHVSRKTASHHVSNILSKLNLRNRAEVAAAAAVGQLPDAPEATVGARLHP